MLPEINLLPKYQRHSSLSYILFLIGMIVSVILFVTLAIFYFNYNGKLNEAEKQFNRLEQEKEILEQQLASLEANQEETLEGAVRFAKQFVLPASPLIDEFVMQLPQDSYLTSYDYNYGSVQIQSQHANKSDVATYVNNLVTSEFMKDVKLNEVDANELIGANHDRYMYKAFQSIEIDRMRLIEEVDHHE